MTHDYVKINHPRTLYGENKLNKGIIRQLFNYCLMDTLRTNRDYTLICRTKKNG